MPFGLSPEVIAALGIGLLGAAYVRGYSGFGFSALFVAWASLWTNPIPLIPVVYACEILMTAFQAKGIRGQIDWGRVRWLVGGAALTLPLAVFYIANVAGDTARVVVSVVIGVLSLILLAGWTYKGRVGGPGHGGVGALSGLCNGVGVGGLPVVAFLAAQPVAPPVFRATMIVYLTLLDAITLPMMYVAGLISMQTVWAALMALPILGVGLWLGGRQFTNASPEGFRRLAIMLLFTLATLGILRALFLT